MLLFFSVLFSLFAAGLLFVVLPISITLATRPEQLEVIAKMNGLTMDKVRNLSGVVYLLIVVFALFATLSFMGI